MGSWLEKGVVRCPTVHNGQGTLCERAYIVAAAKASPQNCWTESAQVSPTTVQCRDNSLPRCPVGTLLASELEPRGPHKRLSRGMCLSFILPSQLSKNHFFDGPMEKNTPSSEGDG